MEEVLVSRIVRDGVDALHQRGTTQRERNRCRCVDSTCTLNKGVVPRVFRGAHQDVLHREWVEWCLFRVEGLYHESGRRRCEGGRLTRSPEIIPRVGPVPCCRHYVGRCEGEGAGIDDVWLRLSGRRRSSVRPADYIVRVSRGAAVVGQPRGGELGRNVPAGRGPDADREGARGW